MLQAAPTACDAYSPTDLLGDTRVYSAGGTVVAIDIRSAAFGSARGVRVGTTLAGVKATYGSALKRVTMNDGGTKVKQWALTTGDRYIAYVVTGDAVTRIAIGYRGDGSITLPQPC